MATNYGSTLGGRQYGRAVAAGGGNAAKGYRQLGGSPSKYGRKKKGGFQLPLGGFGGGGGDWGARDTAYQEALREDIWKKTTPDVGGVGFMTKWRKKADGTWEHTAELGEREKAIRDAAFTRQEMFLDEATRMGSGDWRDIQQERFDQKRALYAGEDAREAAIRRARQHATGASTTGMFAEDARVAANLTQRNMELEEAAFQESQGLIDANLRRGREDVRLVGETAEWANKYLRIPTADPKGNLQNVSDAFTRQMDQEAAYAAAKQKGKDDFWGNILGGATKKIVCTAMNDDYGFGAYRNAIWLKYAELNYKDKPEMEKGYHAIFKPLLKIRKKWYGKPIYAWMKHVARHRSVDLRAEMYGKKRDRIGQAWRFVLEPLCYLVGKRLVNK